jgi:hypothetical protein
MILLPGQCTIERELGRGEAAKRHYGRVTQWWRDCDPELVPLPRTGA